MKTNEQYSIGFMNQASWSFFRSPSNKNRRKFNHCEEKKILFLYMVE